MIQTRVSYQPRGDFILYRQVDRGFVRGIAVPSLSAQGKDNIIIAVGSEVKDLTPGDKVLIVGTEGSMARLPNEQDLYLTRQSNAVCVVHEVPVDLDLSEPA